MIFPPGEITGLPTFLRLTHCSDDTETFFCANSVDDKINAVANNIFLHKNGSNYFAFFNASLKASIINLGSR